jgi:hypothetical protein
MGPRACPDCRPRTFFCSQGTAVECGLPAPGLSSRSSLRLSQRLHEPWLQKRQLQKSDRRHGFRLLSRG